jgi:hypothetical protein
MGYTSEMAIGDLNNDGNVNVVITNSGADQIEVALGLGTGAFVSAAAMGPAPFRRVSPSPTSQETASSMS